MKKIRGVNLGGWLVLEKWMTPELFDGYDALDEFNLLKQLGEKKFRVLEEHRNTFITETDFKWIKNYGLNTVRIPVGHWLFNGIEPYVKTSEYLVRAFNWANKYDINVVLDIHAAPGCQNGFDNGGLQNICEWHKEPENISKTLDFLKDLLVAFSGEKSFFGIEILNEPRWDISMEVIQDFYLKAYELSRDFLDDSHVFIIHDAFRLFEWKDFLKKNNFNNLLLDTHMYQIFSKNDRQRDPFETIQKVSIQRHKELKQVSKYADVIVGEWSLGLHNNALEQLKDSVSVNAFYTAVGNSLLLTFEQTKGWFFWNYKLSEKSTEIRLGWSFREVVAKGYLPNKFEGEIK